VDDVEKITVWFSINDLLYQKYTLSIHGGRLSGSAIFRATLKGGEDMLTIAVCDEIKAANMIVSMISDIQEKLDYEIGVTDFYSMARLKKAMEQGDYFDIIITEVNIKDDPLKLGDPESSKGLELARWIRRSQRHRTSTIIYISDAGNFSFSLLDVEPFHYITKPIDANKLEVILTRACSKVLDQSTSIVYKRDHIIYSMPYDEILYFEVKNREVFMKTAKEVRSFYAPLVTIEKLAPCNFRRFHNAYLINMDYIGEMLHSQIRMVNGDVINISLPKRSKARAEYINYLKTKKNLANE